MSAAALPDPRLGGHLAGSGVVEPATLRWTRRAARAVLRAAFALHVHGLEQLPRTGPVIVAGNHSSFLDGPFVFILLPRPSAFLIKSEIYEFGPLAGFLHAIRQIPVRRGRPDRTALLRGLQVLRDGGVLGMFPEGTRGVDSPLLNIQHGIGYLAVKAGCPIVPVACFGTADALPTGHKLPRLRTRIDVVFGAPFAVSVDGDPRFRGTWAQAAEEVRVHLLAHLDAAAAVTGRARAEARRTA